MADLLELRDRIDEIDHEIARLYEARMGVCREVGEYKIAKMCIRDRDIKSSFNGLQGIFYEQRNNSTSWREVGKCMPYPIRKMTK